MRFDFRAQLTPPVRYVDIRRSFHTVRLLGALLIAALGALAMVWGMPRDGLYFAIPALVLGVHAWRGLVGHSARPFGALLLDTSVIGWALLAIGDIPQAEVAAIGYLSVASLLLLNLSESALAFAYAAAWGAAITRFAPIILASDGRQQSFDRVAMIGLMALFAGMLVLISATVRRTRERQDALLAARSESERLKSDFVAMVSHELRTPLTGIAGFLGMLRRSWDEFSPAEIDEFLSIMGSEAHRLSHLIEDLLTIPRLETEGIPLEDVEIDLAAVARAAIDEVSSGDGPALLISEGVSVHGDPERMHQIVRHLVENAVLHGGRKVWVDADEDGEFIRLIVTDNGAGVPVLDRERIFEPFEQGITGHTRTEGTGVGLTIGRRLARAMGGDLWYEPRSPRGSRFCLTLRRKPLDAMTHVPKAADSRLPMAARPERV